MTAPWLRAAVLHMITQRVTRPQFFRSILKLLYSQRNRESLSWAYQFRIAKTPKNRALTV